MIINDKDVLKEHIIMLRRLSPSQMALMEALAVCFEKVNLIDTDKKKTGIGDFNEFK